VIRILVLKRNCKIIFVAKNLVMYNLIYEISHSMTTSEPSTWWVERGGGRVGEGRTIEMLLSA
jgi:hypothetical protein